MTPELPHPLATTAYEYAEAWKSAGLKGGAAAGLDAYRRLLRTGDASSIPAPFDVADALAPAIHDQIRSDGPQGETVKLLMTIPADALGRSQAERDAAGQGRTLPVECVVIPMINTKGDLSHTLCVSSQVGCAMGCGFCETAQMGLIRDLTPEQIVAQWWRANHFHALPAGKRMTNIVFMGMGEPLDNADSVLRAIEILTDRNGANVAMSKITVSTVGRVDGIRRLKQKCLEHGWHRLGLAVSVNAPNDRVRDSIMPINRRWDMAELRASLVDFPRTSRNKIMIEYVLIPGVNDAPEHADEIAAWCLGLPCCLNIIPYNPRRDSPWPAPTEDSVRAFLERCRSRGVFVKRRQTKGRDTMAACGQLGVEHIRKRRLVTPTVSAG
ncbi:MAG: 23S rRNA (adenine(2503)-C(2))-methyltransferase RlmN [Planctomycetota bacterium]